MSDEHPPRSPSPGRVHGGFEIAARSHDLVVYSRIVGRRYYYESADHGMPLELRRDPENPYDSNAIAVHRPDVPGTLGARLGHIPREHAAWLAPLLDAGLVHLSGMLAEEDKPGGSPILRIAVDVPAGLSELETLPAESSSQAVWHDIVLVLWRRRAETAPEVLRQMYRDLHEAVLAASVFPVTRLLFKGVDGYLRDAAYAETIRKALEAEKAKAVQKRRAAALAKQLRAALSAESCGGLLAYGALRVLPLAATHAAPLMTLPEAFADGRMGFLAARDSSDDVDSFDQVFSTRDDILAVRGALLETTFGPLRVNEDDVLVSDGDPRAELVAEKDFLPRRILPRMFSDSVEFPRTPTLPDRATGFAVFWGADLVALRLFGTHAAAVQALGELPTLDWHIGNGTGVLGMGKARETVVTTLNQFVNELAEYVPEDSDDGTPDDGFIVAYVGSLVGWCRLSSDKKLQAFSCHVEKEERKY